MRIFSAIRQVFARYLVVHLRWCKHRVPTLRINDAGTKESSVLERRGFNVWYIRGTAWRRDSSPRGLRLNVLCLDARAYTPLDTERDLDLVSPSH